MVNTEKELFLEGYKPAWIGSCTPVQNFPYCRIVYPIRENPIVISKKMKVIDRKKVYVDVNPYCPLPELIHFQNEELKEKYLRSINSDRSNWCYQLGISLGYPPAACEHFSKTSKPNTFINMNGMGFTTDFSLAIENVKWLQENYLIPDEILKISIENRQTRNGIIIRGRNVDFEELNFMWNKLIKTPA